MAYTKDELRTLAENDLYVFACLINPHRVYGEIHKELFRWWTRQDANLSLLSLLPRDHQKSHCAAVYAVWMITRNPAISIFYCSATADLAEKQLRAIQNMLTSEVYTSYWSDMVEPEEGKRRRWTTSEIEVDHPLRRQEGVRDVTVAARGITANSTGLHCDLAILDDVVVPRNAYTAEGRRNVDALYSQLASIETTGARELIVGTRYHPQDLYSKLIEMEVQTYDDDGIEVSSEPLYEVFERVVEDSSSRDGSGTFLWEKQRRSDGKVFGFNAKELAIKRAKYLDREQFYAQYYNDPNDPSMERIDRSNIQYYDKANLSQTKGKWYIKDRELSVYAAMDFAFSTAKRADYTAIVVIGIDFENNIYVLDVIRFKTDKISEMFQNLLDMHIKWDFRKVAAEISVAQVAIVREFKTYMTKAGVFFVIAEHRPTRHEGTKEERMEAILVPRYENSAVYHYKGGMCAILEEEVVSNRPQHDDMKDALANAISIARAPAQKRQRMDNVVKMYNSGGSRFGRSQ